jgi:hypothetical protein
VYVLRQQLTDKHFAIMRAVKTCCTLQADMSAAKQETEALRITCSSLKEQLQSRVTIGRAVVGDYGGTITTNNSNNISNSNGNVNTVQQQQQASSAHHYSNGLYTMSSSSNHHHQQQHHNGGNTDSNATTTWDNVHMSVEIERLRSIAQERGSQVCMHVDTVCM